MAFNSFEFAGLLAGVFLLYWLLGRRGQNGLLLVASYVFYGWWDWRFLGLIWVSTIVDFLVGRALGGADEEQRRRRLLAISVVVNLGILAFFKYFDFFAAGAADLLRSVGLEATEPTLRIVLPVGISFYTFQTMSYTIDVYRRRLEPTRDLLAFAVFVAFFPQLVAGPIERARRLLPQFAVRRTLPDRERLAGGLVLILIGLVKKVAIADALAPYVQETFAAAGSAGWLQLLVGVYAFSLQIYGDFSGYSDIARGSARLLGIDLMRNFEQPYLARNITHFWQTWHISLSTWLRDYLYVPLGGNRGSKWATGRNLMITMLLGGLWHGAAGAFVVWGGLHGLYLAGHRLVRARSPGTAADRPTRSDLLPVLLTFHLVAFTWIPFRASSLGSAGDYLGGLLTLRDGPIPGDALGVLLPALVVVLLLDLAQRSTGSHTPMLRWHYTRRGLAYGLGVVAVLVFSGQAAVPFLYFQF